MMIQNRQKILFCIPHLGGGGAEKILVETLRKLDTDKYDITVLSIFNTGVYREDVKNICDYRYVIPMPKPVFMTKVIIKVLLRLVFRIMSPKMLYKLCVNAHYDIEVAYLEGLAVKVMSGSTNKRSRKFAWVHSDPIAHPYSTRSFLNVTYEKNAYAMFDKILCISTSVQKSFIERYRVEPSRTKVQLNVIDEVAVVKKSRMKTHIAVKPRTIIAVGRLSPEKGFLMLLAAVARLKQDGVKFSLLIVGEGQQRGELEDYIRQNNLSDFVNLVGFVANPYPLIARSCLLVSSSYTEGFGMVVSEAIILGVPVVTTSSGGTYDILGDSEYGLITPVSEDGLYEGLRRALRDEEYLNHLKIAAKARADFFSVASRIHELDDLFLEDGKQLKTELEG